MTYSFLPVNHYNLKFLLHANFDVTASRDTLKDSQRNSTIKQLLVKGIKQSMNELKIRNDTFLQDGSRINQNIKTDWHLIFDYLKFDDVTDDFKKWFSPDLL